MRDLKADLELCNKATPGPWEICLGSGVNLCTAVMTADGKYMICDCLPDWFLDEGAAPENHVPNLQFIAEAREGWPHAIERALKAEALAQKLLDVLGRVIPRYLVGRLELMDLVPEATVVRGEWTTNSDYPDTVICSLCGWRESVWWADKGTNYCPNCGAKMEVK